MNDEEETPQEISVGMQEAQEIIDWALSAATMLFLMESAPIPDSIEQAMEKLDGLVGAVEIVCASVPEVLINPAMARAQYALDEVQEAERIVEEFREEIKDL